jgi:hypothetical protein
VGVAEHASVAPAPEGGDAVAWPMD